MLIAIEKYPVFVKLGHFFRERLEGQEILVSLAAELEFLWGGDMGDNLSETLDYGLLFAAIDRELANREIKLVETAVLRLGHFLMKEYRLIASLEILVEKPILPHGLNKGARVSVSHRFDRQQFSVAQGAGSCSP